MLWCLPPVTLHAVVDDNMICNEIGRGRQAAPVLTRTFAAFALVDVNGGGLIVLLFLRNYPKIRGFFISLFSVSLDVLLSSSAERKIINRFTGMASQEG